MDILLTHGYCMMEDPHELQVRKPYPPLGILYISSHLKAKGFDTAVYDSVEQVVDGTFQGGEDFVFNLANDGVALGKISPEVPQELIDEVDGLKQQIIDGEITPPAE